jgi:HAD superfamily phosphatase (TIGR01681 family)
MTTFTKRQKLDTNLYKIPIKRKRSTLKPILETDTVNTGTNTDKQLKDYKIFVFDLDNTLYLHNVDEDYAEMYHKKVKNFLMYLKDSDKLLYIATHNFNPGNYLSKIDILQLFDGIIKETKDVHPWLNSIIEYTSKKDMVLEILNKHNDLKKEDVVFFDDHNYNIKEVESINVKSIYVDNNKGIDFNEIY